MNDELRNLLERRKKIILARDDLIHFAEYMSPSPDAPDDMSVSLYRPAKHHKVMAVALEEVEALRIMRLYMSLPPRHGKTKLASHMFTAWFIGRHPEKSIILATYSEKFSWDHGRAVRKIIESKRYRQVFPDLKLRDRAISMERIETQEGGVLFFLGRGSGTTGRGADIILIDDPIKDRKEADSKGIRETLWSWYTQVIQTRLMTRKSAIILIQTRWHEDDLPGRLMDPMNPCFSEMEAKKWRVIDMPAIARAKDVLGRKEGEALWPERFDLDHLVALRQTDLRGFEALYQGSPAPAEGAFFDSRFFNTYKRVGDRPPNEKLRFYGASDHAVSLDQGRDKTCLMVVGVDEHDQIWIMHDIFWKQADTATVVEMMCLLMERYQPVTWWAEKGHIEKSIGPFLRRRMLEKKVYCSIVELGVVGDKQQRAQSIHAKMAMQSVRFPSFPHWWAEAHDELLKFPHGTHDDFVDTLSLIGLGLWQIRGQKGAPKPKIATEQGTFGWVIADSNRVKREEERKQGGW